MIKEKIWSVWNNNSIRINYWVGITKYNSVKLTSANVI